VFGLSSENLVSVTLCNGGWRRKVGSEGEIEFGKRREETRVKGKLRQRMVWARSLG